MNFTQDWFSHNIPNITASISKMGGTVNKILEIGSFEGRSACWFIQNVLPDNGEILCLDIWEPTEQHPTVPKELFETFSKNIQAVEKGSQIVQAVKGLSYDSLGILIAMNKNEYFDLVYVDGSHRAYDTITDMTMAWGLLRKGGLMLVDDYLWDHKELECDKPKIAVDSFIKCFYNQCEVIHKGWQVHIIKK